MPNPKVSVVITAYNLEKFIDEAIQSVLNQTYKDFEIIVVNNGSTDKTGEIIKRFCESNHNIRLLVNQENKHIGGGYNAGIKIAKGDYVAILDGDDIWHKEKLELQVKALEKNPEAGLISSFAAIIDSKSRLTGWRVGRNLNGAVLKNVLEINGIPSVSAVLIRKCCFDKVGLFKKSSIVSDWDFYIRLSEYFPVVTVPKVLVGFRRHSTNMSKNYIELESDMNSVLDDLFKDKYKSDGIFKKKYYSGGKYVLAVLCTIDGEYDLAIKNLKESFSISPFSLFLKPNKVIFALLLLSFKIFPMVTSWLVTLLQNMSGIKTGKKFKMVYG